MAMKVTLSNFTMKSSFNLITIIEGKKRKGININKFNNGLVCSALFFLGNTFNNNSNKVYHLYMG